MLKAPLLVGTAMVVGALNWSGSAHAASEPVALIPWPKEVRQLDGAMSLTSDSRIVYSDDSLQPLAEVLARDLAMLTSLEPQAARAQPRPGDIALVLAGNPREETYTFRVDDTATLTGSNADTLALATATLLQALDLTGDAPALPRMAVRDQPDSEYRGLMIDVARQPHTIHTIKQVVELCRFYKIRYLHLHLTDDQLFMFPSEAFPDVTTANNNGVVSYTQQELEDLVDFAKTRGVILIPEFDVPGHSGALNRAMPDLFKIKDTKPYEHHASINIGREETVEAVKTITGEMIEVFDTSPYFHIGGDEADLRLADQNKYFQAAYKRLGLGEHAHGQLYRWFLTEMNDYVQEQGKQTIVWEGFHREPRSKFQIPRNVVVMLYENQFYLPQHLLEDGYPVINTAWTPLYVLKKHHWPAQRIFNWSLTEFGSYGKNFDNVRWSRVDSTKGIIGGQMCSWEQPAWSEVLTLRTRLPAMSERIWTHERQRGFDEFNVALKQTDARLDRLFSPITFEADALVDAHYNGFVDSTQVTLASRRPGVTIRYTLGDDLPDAGSTAYTSALPLNQTVAVTAQAYDESTGEPVGFPVRADFTKIQPHYTYKAYVPGGEAWSQLPDFARLQPVVTGVLGGNADVAHILPNYAQFAAVLEGRVNLPADDSYSFAVTGVEDVRIYIDGEPVKQGVHDNQLHQLAAGEHDLRVEALFNSMGFDHELVINLAHGAEAEAQANALKNIAESALATPRVSSNQNVINFKSTFPPDQQSKVRGYVARILNVTHDSKINVITGSDDGLRVWVNGTLIQEVNRVRAQNLDSESAEAQLRTGKNELLVEVSQDGGNWSLSLRMEDAQGNPLTLEPDGDLVPASGNKNSTYVRDWHFAPETRPYKADADPENNLPLVPIDVNAQ